MKFNIFHKHLTAVAIIVLAIIIIAFLSINLIFDKQKNKNDIKECDIAIITYDDIDNAYFEMIEEGVKKSSDSLSKKYSIFSVSDYKNSYYETIKAAVESEAVLVVLPDSTFEETLYNYQKEFTRTRFILIDGVPRNQNSNDITVNYNVIPVLFDEAEIGFIAGYASVYEGCDRLCFVCEDSDTKSMHFCYGFLQGADYAAGETGLKNVKVDILSKTSDKTMNAVLNGLSTDTDIVATADADVINALAENDGSETVHYPVIFCGGYHLKNDNIVATVTYDIAALVNDVIIDYYADNVSGGAVVNFNTGNNAISFVTEDTMFERFSSAVKKGVLNKIANGEITIISDTTVSTEELGLENISVRIKQ